MPILGYKCKICPADFKKATDIRQHIYSMHKTKCWVQLVQILENIDETLPHREPYKYICNFCSEFCRDRADMMAHWEKYHQPMDLEPGEVHEQEQGEVRELEPGDVIVASEGHAQNKASDIHVSNDASSQRKKYVFDKIVFTLYRTCTCI